MKLLTAFVTALTVLGFAGAALAMCPGAHQPKPETTAQDPLLLPKDVGA
jgi:hypothetical protein